MLSSEVACIIASRDDREAREAASLGLSRLELWNALEGVSVVEPLLLAAYEREAEREWRSGDDDSPHGEKWSTSFHASQFPGDDPLACGRAALYGLMDLPGEKPREPFLSAWFDLGSNLEHDWVRRFAADGVLLSKSPAVGDDYQTVFLDEEHWLSGASDAIILPPFWRKGHCVEVKTTSHEKTLAMCADRDATPYSHSKYVRQLKTYIGLAHEAPFAPTVTVCEDSWAITKEAPMDLRWCPVHHSFDCSTIEIQLDPPDDGTLIYSSREEPLTTASYYFSYDPDFLAAGRARLAEWRDYYERGELPPHPLENQRKKWTADPCRFCLDPSSLVLTADLEWVSAESLTDGDQLIGFDEEFVSGQQRSRYRFSTVEAVPVIERPRLRITTDQGNTICSDDHQFLVTRARSRAENRADGIKSRARRRCWVEARALKVSDRIVAFGQPWLANDSREACYLSGLFDGEGSVAHGGHVSFSQCDNIVLTHARKLLTELGFSYRAEVVSHRNRRPCWRVRINGGMYEQLRFVGSVRPLRLIEQSRKLWEGHATWSQRSGHAVVESVEALEPGPVIAIATSTRTLVADGMLSHNCNFAGHKEKGGCKADYAVKLTRLADSTWIPRARDVRPEYDYEATRASVFARWGESDPLLEEAA